MNRLVRILIIFFLFLFSSCGLLPYFSVIHINDTSEILPDQLIYALPKTLIKVEVKLVKTNFYAGPFSSYASEFLGISGAPQNDSVFHKIADIQIHSVTESDPLEMYTLTANKINSQQFLQLSNEGFICSPDKLTSTQTEHFFTNEIELIPFQETTSKSHKEVFAETYYRIEQQDSVFVKVPILKKEAHIKELKDKAEEAAYNVIKYRKEQYRVVARERENFPDGKYAEVSLAELKRLETGYLSLFIGKTYSDTLIRNFYLDPEDRNTSTLFYLSDNDGFTQNNYKTKPIDITIRSLNKTNLLAKEQEDLLENTIYYRVPDKALIEVEMGGKIIASKYLNIYQFGKIVAMPVTFK